MSALTATSPGAQSISIGGPVRPSTNGSHSYQQQSQNQQQLGAATVYVTASPTPSSGSQDGDQQQQQPASTHIVKIRISPSCNGNSGISSSIESRSEPISTTTSSKGGKRIVSAVRLNEEEPSSIISGVSMVSLQKVGADNDEVMHVSSHGPVRISVKSTYSSSESVGSSSTDMNTSKETLPGCFCCSSPPNSMLSGHCSPSETLDSGTCSDLDGTPPPPSLQQRQLLKKTSSDAPTSMLMPTLRGSSGSATSSGAELDSDDDVESSISCDSIEVSSTISSSTTLQQAYSNNNNKKPLVSERTYEERSRPIPIRGASTEPSESNGRCYLYEDDRHYQFHVNEREEVRKMEQQLAAKNLANASEQEQEFFAGVQTGRDKEAIRSAKGTVRGVKNRVRAGIATFLQTPAAKLVVRAVWALVCAFPSCALCSCTSSTWSSVCTYRLAAMWLSFLRRAVFGDPRNIVALLPLLSSLNITINRRASSSSESHILLQARLVRTSLVQSRCARRAIRCRSRASKHCCTIWREAYAPLDYSIDYPARLALKRARASALFVFQISLPLEADQFTVGIAALKSQRTEAFESDRNLREHQKYIAQSITYAATSTKLYDLKQDYCTHMHRSLPGVHWETELCGRLFTRIGCQRRARLYLQNYSFDTTRRSALKSSNVLYATSSYVEYVDIARVHTRTRASASKCELVDKEARVCVLPCNVPRRACCSRTSGFSYWHARRRKLPLLSITYKLRNAKRSAGRGGRNRCTRTARSVGHGLRGVVHIYTFIIYRFGGSGGGGGLCCYVYTDKRKINLFVEIAPIYWLRGYCHNQEHLQQMPVDQEDPRHAHGQVRGARSELQRGESDGAQGAHEVQCHNCATAIHRWRVHRVNRTFGPSSRIFSEILTIVDYISLSIYINCYTPAIIMSDQLVRRQNELKDKLTKSYGNFAKLGQKQMTEGANEVRLARHREWWEEFERNHEELVNSVDYDPNIPYFKEGCYNITEEAYMVSLGSYLDLQKYYEGLKPRSQVVGPPAPMSRLSLKPIEPPTFSGEYGDWEEFREIFTSLVINDRTLSQVDRMHYLKTHVKGSAEALLKGISVTSENFDVAWNALKSEYDNKRRLVASQVAAIRLLAPAQEETSVELRRVLMGVRYPLARLAALKRPVKYWGDVLVDVLLSRLDQNTIREWDSFYHLEEIISPQVPTRT
ncbi:unnamed protein product [Trichogramma brassicae]|uniref:Uncharacterized protein n=1 Tax=Trichogramma brassicae TaxID=86971 RepID=A0A6H5IZ23_9HYME|nr:unnamed protein product [Trichogramma brassicae]